MKTQRLTVSRLLIKAALLVVLFSVGTVPVTAQGTVNTERISVALDGTQANNDSYWPSISADGRYVAFSSRANNLVNNDNDDQLDIFVFDQETRQITLVSDLGSALIVGGPSISADGRYVAFNAYPFWGQIYVHDTQTGQTAPVSVSSGGTLGNDNSGLPTISGDGRFVAFESVASNLVSGDTENTLDAFIHDRQTGQTTRITQETRTGGNGVLPTISTDGRFVTFHSSDGNLVSGDTNGDLDVFVFDGQTDQITRVSVASDGAQGNDGSGVPAISADGHYVAFLSLASNLASGDSPDTWDVFIHDRQTHTTTRITEGTKTSANLAEPHISMSADGRYVAYRSVSQGLVFVYDRQSGQTTLISAAPDGTPGSSPFVKTPSISADGRYVAFSSTATNLVNNDTNGFSDVFVSALLPHLQTSQQETITETGDTAWIAYLGSDSNIWLIDPISGEQRQLTHSGEVTSGPAWSPDGMKLAAAVGGQQNFIPDREIPDVLIIDLTTGDLEQLGIYAHEGDIPPVALRNLAWSPDGSTLYYSIITDPLGRNLYLRSVQLNGESRERIPSFTPNWLKEGPIAFSPDGRWLSLGLVEQLALIPVPDSNYGIWLAEADGQNLHQLVVGISGASAWSPNGTQIAHSFSSGVGDRGIHIVNVDDGNTRRLTEDGGSPTWSPDGLQIAFEKLIDGSSSAEIWLMNAADGAHQRKLVDGSGPAWRPIRPRASSTEASVEEKIVFTCTLRDFKLKDDGTVLTHPVDGAKIFDQRDEICTVNVDGSDLTRLTYHDDRGSGFTTAWSPDGKQIAFVRNCDYFLMNADGSSLTRLFDGPVSCGGMDLTWSSDGKQIAFSLDSNIYLINVDGSGLTRLADGYGPTWSPDGTRIAFRLDGIYVMNADGSSQMRLSDGYSPDWSPDGSQVIFASTHDGNSEIYIMNVDGNGVTRLTNRPEIDLDPAWSSDGSRIVFTSIRDGDSDIYIMNADGSGVISLAETRNEMNDGLTQFVGGAYPDWSPSTFTSTRGTPFDSSAGEAPPTLPTSSPKPIAPPASASYKLVYTKWDGGRHNLYIGDTEGDTEQFILHNGAGPSWSTDGQSIFFCGEPGVNLQNRDIYPDVASCELPGVSDGLVAIAVPPAPLDICRADGSFYQGPGWNVGTARWASVSPDGSLVAYDARPGGNYRIYFLSLADNQQSRFELVGEQGDWSPDSQRVVYRSGRDGKTGLWISNRDDSGHTLITNNGTDSFPAWSPDGATIAFSRDEGGNVDIYTVSADGSNVKRLTDAPGPDTLPTYTPNGEIIFRSARTGSWGIWRMNDDGSNQSEIIPNAGVGPDWAYSKMDVLP